TLGHALKVRSDRGRFQERFGEGFLTGRLVDELVAVAANAYETSRGRRVALDLAPEVAHVHVDGPRVGDELRLPEVAHDRDARVPLPGARRGRAGGGELGRGQMEVAAVHRDLVPRGVERKPAEAADPAAATALELPAAQLRPHPAHQLPRRERLHDV